MTSNTAARTILSMVRYQLLDCNRNRLQFLIRMRSESIESRIGLSRLENAESVRNKE